MKKSEWATLIASAVAILISLGSLVIAWRAEQRSTAAERPVVEWKLTRLGLRGVRVDLTVRNTAFGSADVRFMDLLDPHGAVLLAIRPPATAVDPDQRTSMVFGPPRSAPYRATIEDSLQASESRTYPFQIAIKDEDAAPLQMTIRINLTIEVGNISKSPVTFMLNRVL